MKHYWAIVKARSSTIKMDAEKRLGDQLPSNLSIFPDEVAAHEIDERTFVVSCSANCQTFGYQHPYRFTKGEATLVEGLPSLERFNVKPASDIPENVSDILKKYSIEDVYQKLGGVWSIGSVDHNSSILVFSNFCGYTSCYYYVNDDIVVVGNNAKFISLLRTGSNRDAVNWKSLSWIASTTMMWGHETAFSGVKKIPPGDYFVLEKDSMSPKIRSFATNYFSPLYLPTESDKTEFIQSTIDGMCNRVSWYLNRGIKLTTHLTGGKDTRMALALLLGSGSIQQVTKIETTGDEDNGDVIVARKIARECGLEGLHHVRAGNKSKVGMTSELLAKRFFNCNFKYEAQLTPFDGANSELAKLPNACPIMGGGGEIYRNKMNIDLGNDSTAFSTLLNAYCRYDKLNLLTPEAKEFQAQYIQSELEHFKHNEIKNPEMKFYIDQRLSNWGQGHFRHGGGTQIPMLIDFDLTRLQASSANNKSEDIHFNIIRYAYPDLLKIPFLNQRWGGTTRNDAASIGADLDPIEVAVSKSFPWQFDVYPKVRDVCLSMLLENFEGFSPWISLNAVEELFQSEVKPNDFNSADIKIIFGLAMAASQMSNQFKAMPDNLSAIKEKKQPELNKYAQKIFPRNWVDIVMKYDPLPLQELKTKFDSAL